MAANNPLSRVTRKVRSNRTKLDRIEREIENVRKAVANLQEIMTELRMRVNMAEREQAKSA